MPQEEFHCRLLFLQGRSFRRGPARHRAGRGSAPRVRPPARGLIAAAEAHCCGRVVPRLDPRAFPGSCTPPGASIAHSGTANPPAAPANGPARSPRPRRSLKLQSSGQGERLPTGDGTEAEVLRRGSMGIAPVHRQRGHAGDRPMPEASVGWATRATRPPGLDRPAPARPGGRPPGPPRRAAAGWVQARGSPGFRMIVG